MSRSAQETARRNRLRRRSAAICGLALLLALFPPTIRYARSAGLLLRVIDPSSAPLPLVSHTVEEHDTTLALVAASLRARVYAPIDAPDAPGIVLLHGVHPRGIDEARLVAFARSLAAVGVNVLTPELPELLQYRIEAGTVQRIADIARVHATSIHAQAVGVIGISFAGGLALMAADHARDASSMAFVVTVGAHHDLMRLSRFYAGLAVIGPHGETALVKPHPYGARVLLRQHLERFFDAADLALARQALDLYLHDEHAQAKQVATSLSPEGRETMAVLLDESQTQELGKLLMRASELARHELEAASPRGQLSHIRVPVYLIHGERDPVIPSIETRWLAQEIPARVLRRTVITPLLRHAEFPAAPTLRDSWQLLSLMADVLRQADATRFRSPRTDL